MAERDDDGLILPGTTLRAGDGMVRGGGITLHDYYVGQAIAGLCAGGDPTVDDFKYVGPVAHDIAAGAIAEKQRREKLKK